MVDGQVVGGPQQLPRAAKDWNAALTQSLYLLP